VTNVRTFHAIRHLPANYEVYYIEFAVKPYKHLLDYYLPGRWWCSNGTLDLATVPPGPGMANRHIK
jgi:hypothetical protein